MDFAELKAAVGTRCGIASTDAAYTRIGDAVNEALHSIETFAGGVWDWLIYEDTITTTANQDYLTFAAIASDFSIDGVRQVRRVECQNGSGTYDLCERRSKRQLRDTFQGFSAQPIVVAWAAEGQRLWLFPTPSLSTITLRVTVLRTEPDLTGTNEPIMPATYHRVLVAAAAGLLLRSLQRHDEAKIEEEAAAQGLSRIPGASMPSAGPGYVYRSGRS